MHVTVDHSSRSALLLTTTSLPSLMPLLRRITIEWSSYDHSIPLCFTPTPSLNAPARLLLVHLLPNRLCERVVFRLVHTPNSISSTLLYSQAPASTRFISSRYTTP
ncbi:hypothetical protein RSAG8_12713, partial [Rhizoctonia solani AG-8 WAC10335]